MGKKLVIVESPAKAKTIGKILGSKFVVKSSVGHIRDLPERTLGVDIENGFTPKYVLSKEKNKVVSELKKEAKACDEIYLAPDPDREGEAIAWHLHETLLPSAKTKPFFRVQYNEITPRAVHAAFEHPGEIDMQRVNAQQARRVLDRIVGYMVSPMLWRRIKKGLSAGRVQSVALRLVSERERQIQAFKPEAYWVMGAQVRRETDPLDPFTLRLARIDGKKPELNAEEMAREVLDDLKGSQLKVSDLKTREVIRRPIPPFITSTLQQAASSFCSFSPNRTMSLAQKLYEGVDLGHKSPIGLITYMRTDSVNVARDAQEDAKNFIVSTFGPEYYPEKPNFYKSRESAQEAHEAIRPTDVTRTPESLKGVLDAPALKLYELIWRRFVASQMAPAKIQQRTATVTAFREEGSGQMKHSYLFTATSSQPSFEGFLKVMALDFRKKKGEDEGEKEDSDEVDRLPPLEIGLPLHLIKWLSERKETKPPARYSEASLIKALEANGVGRPSTYASIIETLNARDYTSREKRQLVPTSLGLEVNDMLVSKLDSLFDVGFTAKMEDELDKVEAGGVEWTRMLSDFYDKFTIWMEHAKEPPADSGKVEAMLALLAQIKEWGPAVKRGNRVYSDEKFVTSICEQKEEGKKPISDKQLLSLAKLVVRYRAQLPGAEEKLRENGFEEILEQDKAVPCDEELKRRFEILKNVPMTESQGAFVSSLQQQVEIGRRLSEKQVASIDRMIVQSASKIANFEAVKKELKITLEAENAPVDTESQMMMEMLVQITKWQEPVTHGKRTYDDAAFCKSLATQFDQKKSLSPRQRFALKRILFRYREQIKDFDSYAEKLGMSKKLKTDQAQEE